MHVYPSNKNSVLKMRFEKFSRCANFGTMQLVLNSQGMQLASYNCIIPWSV